MRCLIGDQWSNVWLDHYCGPDDYRIQVAALANLERLTGIYFVRERSARMLWNYIREVGLVEVWRKVESRYRERFRNEKFTSFGLGTVLKAPDDGLHDPGKPVMFLAPGFSACVERVVLPPALVAAAPAEALQGEPSGIIRYLELQHQARLQGAWWRRVSTWNRYSGEEFSEEDRGAIARSLSELADEIDWSSARRLPISPPSQVRERVRNERSPRLRTRSHRTRKKRGVLFGYGHYAKTNILPNVVPYVDVHAIHEVDPTQISPNQRGAPYWDTAPIPRPPAEQGDFDVYFIAGYHYSHAPLSVTALQRGAYAVAEKPLAVDRVQLEELLSAMKTSDAGFFGCFHKRYSPLNDYAIADLRQSPAAPIDYHCIVYEVPLPEQHWYRWPNSKSRLISNGCHWIDHFLYLNGFKEVDSLDLSRSPSGTINCSATLVNGAYFTMTLTDKGSERIGLQEHVELRARKVTVTIRNNSSYLAENYTRVMRKLRINKMHGYNLMYREIAQRIARGEEGDSYDSVRVSTSLVLDLEDALTRSGGHGF